MERGTDLSPSCGHEGLQVAKVNVALSLTAALSHSNQNDFFGTISSLPLQSVV